MNYDKSTLTAAAITCGILAFVTGLEACPSCERPAIPIAPGDLNGNGAYDFDDVAILRSVVLGAPISLPKVLYDVDLNGQIDRNDLAMLTHWAERSTGHLDPPEFSPLPIALDPELRVVIRGDVDGDGDVDAYDAVHLQDVVMGVVRPKNGFESADVNADGSITLDDLYLLAEILWGKREPKP